MSVDSGGGFTRDDRMPEALRDAGYDVLAYLYERYAARVFDYCLGVLRDEDAAVVAVQDTLVALDAQIAKLPDLDRLRVSLYSVAHRQCQSRLSRRRVKRPRSSETTSLDEFITEQADTGGQATGGAAAAALNRLADRDREVLNLAFRHGIQGADLAAVLSVSSRRARAMLSDAGTRFRKSAAVVAVLRCGLAGCEVLQTITGTSDPVTPPLTPERRDRLTRHLESCPRCTGQRGDEGFDPEMLAAIPLATPPLTLRLRITGPTLPLGSYQRGGRGRASATGGNVLRPRVRRGPPHAMMVSSLGLVILAVPGALLYELVFTPPAAPWE
jgi:DNA-directed RNA polymerase specialized sigma24 family protein